MIQLNFDKQDVWYMGLEFEDIHLVTDKNYNKELGISSIILEKPKTDEPVVLAGVTIRFTNRMEVEGTIYAQKNGKDMHFSTRQQKLTNREGKPYYIPVDVKVPMAISAQVLRYAETKRKEEVALIPAGIQPTVLQNPAYAAPIDQQYYQQQPLSPQEIAQYAAMPRQ